jgi:1-acyl-sn-glycerol-3-phosphate acyltransferase
MIATTLEEFQDSIRATGGYATAPDHRAAVRAKPGAWTTWRYSCGILRVFPLAALHEPTGHYTQDVWCRHCFSTVRVAEKLGMTVSVEGFGPRAAHDGPVVYLCNHMSTTETIFLPTVLMSFGAISYVAKASLSRLPFLSKAAAHMGMVPVTRTSPREDLLHVLRVGTERLKAGGSFLVFPQGTRQEVFSRKVYSSLGAKLAEKAGCPIVPIVVDTRCQLTREKGILRRLFKDFGPVDPSFDIRCAAGPVVPCGKAREMHEAAFDWMAGKLESWGLPTDRAAK